MPTALSTDLRIRIVEARAQDRQTYEQLAERFGVGRASVSRVLRLAREERCTVEVTALREAFIERMQRCDPERLIFLDESGSHTSMTRRQAWAPKGERARSRAIAAESRPCSGCSPSTASRR